MRKKLIGAIALFSIVLVIAVALLFRMEPPQDSGTPTPSGPAASEPAASEEAATEISTSEAADATQAPEQTTAPAETEDSTGDELIIVPEQSQTEAAAPQETQPQTTPTEYTPPEGLEEDQTPIL